MKLLKMMMIMVIIIIGGALGDIVDGTCKQTPDYTFCVSLLRSDPRSSSADTAGLAIILVDKIKMLGMNTLEQIKNAYKTKPFLKEALDQCNFGYKTLLEQFVPEAYEALPGNPKFAEDGVVGCNQAASICEDGFPIGQSPFTALTIRIVKISDVARAIIRTLL